MKIKASQYYTKAKQGKPIIWTDFSGVTDKDGKKCNGLRII